MATLELTSGDTAPDLSGTVNAVLTGAALEVHVQRDNAATIVRAGVVTDAAAGAWSMPWQDGDLHSADRPARYAVEVQVTFASGKVQTFGPVQFYVKPQIA